MKKCFFALLFALILLLGSIPAAALEGETLRATDQLATLNLVEGDGTGYALDSPVSRAQAAVLLVRLSGTQKSAIKDLWISGFRDLPAWCFNEVAHASHAGWVKGVSMTEFRPNSPVTANAWFTMLLRMLGYSDQAGDFAVEDAAAFAQQIGLTPRSYTGTMTRGNVFESMRDALTFSYKGQDETIIVRLIRTGTTSRAAANALGLLDTELTARQAADRHMAAVFCLDLYGTQEDIDNKKPSSNASGFFISPDGLAITNHHSIQNGIYGTATLCTGDVYEITEVLYYDEAIDIAVIRVSQTSTTHKTTSAFAYLDLAGAADLRHGDVVYTLGNPLGLGLAVSSGIVSDPARKTDGYALPCVMNTADISRGSSGGALLNIYGDVIAVTSGAYTFGNNMYLAVPVDPVLSADLSAPGITLADLSTAEKAEKN